MSFGRSHWCRPMSMDAHRSTDQDEDRSTDYSGHRSTSSAESTAECSAVRIMSHEEFVEKHPHPPSPFYAPLTYRVRLPSIDSNRINALRPPPKPLANPPEPTTNPSETTPEPMEANEKEMDGFTKRVLRIPVEKYFDEVYYTHRLWMFFRETKETEEDIRRMFHYIRELMKLRITLKKKSDPGKFAIPCMVKGIEFLHALCHPGASVSILPMVMADQLDPDVHYDLVRVVRQQVNVVELGNDLGYIAACHCEAEYETEYSESIDTHTITSIDSNESSSMNAIPRRSTGCSRWVDSGFHESFAVETVILSSNEDPTEEYDEDYWKERATEIAMQDERYSTHSFNNTPPPSIDNVYSASVDTHPHPAN
ncbi:hypothetical protein F2Q70_00035940 [Brassica cretica]|uniref:Uncharacterized protein n=1 Tax=Brassica cretica TaxID=69181 RepID=A0A8S9JQE2_BRACR|nr:hypothetical protein F2Q70_00035940 [Brassica cretica]